MLSRSMILCLGLALGLPACAEHSVTTAKDMRGEDGSS